MWKMSEATGNMSAVLDLTEGALPELATRGVAVPEYDRSRLRPRIVHIGVGGFHRAHLALYTDRAAAAGGDWGIVGLGLLENDARMAEALCAQDHLYTLVERSSDRRDVRVVGSIIGFVHAPPGHDDEVADLLASPETAILSLTVTEGGYVEPTPEQLAEGTSTFDRLARGLQERRRRGLDGLTVLSCDNLPGNGRAAHTAMAAAAARLDEDLARWVEQTCSFPDSMVDRITPVTADADIAWLAEEKGLADRWPVVGEPFRQWVLQDRFVAGRPVWEDDGALFTDDVHAWELYKLRMLNAGHSTMAYLAHLAGIVHVDKAMATPEVAEYFERFEHDEALPGLTEIPGHPREDYIATLRERFSNTGVRDQVARLCIDGTAKFPTFLVPTIESALDRGGPIARGTLALAAWARYLGTVPLAEQAHDAHGERSRTLAVEALDDPTAFLELTEVFTEGLRGSSRFRATFAAAYRTIEAEGALAAMRVADRIEATQGDR